MPIHDWTKVTPGIFHDFHGYWIQVLKRALNDGLLPQDCYALSEQVIITRARDDLQVKRRKNRIAVRQANDDRVVAMIEIVSRGNKSSQHAIQAFVGKAVDLLANGVHLLIIDIQPQTRRDPDGIHSLIQQEFGGPEFLFPPEKEFTLAAYHAVDPPRAYIEPVEVGDELPDMPLFLMPGGHVLVPLEKTYRTAWEGVPARWREVIEAPVTPPK